MKSKNSRNKNFNVPKQNQWETSERSALYPLAELEYQYLKPEDLDNDFPFQEHPSSIGIIKIILLNIKE